VVRYKIFNLKKILKNIKKTIDFFLKRYILNSKELNMKKIENKGQYYFSAVYSNDEYSKIYKIIHENKKMWVAISRYNNERFYFDRLCEI